MIFHASFAASDPQRVATLIAELWGGAAMPFPPVGRASWVAMAGDLAGSVIEIYSADEALHPGPFEAKVHPGTTPARFGPTHFAISTRRSETEVFALAAREGWQARTCWRGAGEPGTGPGFGVIEVWIENRLLIEVLAQEMQRDYLAVMTIANWRAQLDDMEMRAAA